MQTITPLFGSEKSDPQTIKQWAAEEQRLRVEALK